MTYVDRCWHQRAVGWCSKHGAAPTVSPERPRSAAPLRTVTMPANGLRMTPEMLVGIILAQVEDNAIDLIAEPAPELVAAWKRGDAEGTNRTAICSGWTAWGPLCLVCHRDVPEGLAAAYPFLLGSRACIGDCAAHLDSLLKVYDRSRRGRWRPTREVHDLVNGMWCDVPHEVSR